MVEVNWLGKMAFESNPPSGVKFIMDAHEDSGGEGRGPSPLETLLSAAAACSAMDVISILHKKKQVVTSYRIEVDGDRGPEGVYPRPYLALRVKHIVKGENIDPVAVARAVELSDTKYCTVLATLRQGPKVTSTWEIEE
jgi:putative redox protein